MKTFKVSHTIIKQWKQGRYEEAIAQYLGKPLPPTPEMELGRLYDEKWNKHIEKTGELPKELGEGKLIDPIVQKKYQLFIPFSEEYQILLRGVLDIHELSFRITDNKCGRSEANNYMSDRQLDYYSLFDMEAKEGVYRCYNPYFDSLTIGVKYFNDTTREQALNEIITYSGDIIQYLIANKLFIDYKENVK